MRRLASYADGSVSLEDTQWNPMHGFAGRMAPEDRTAVALYLASLDGADPLEPDPIDGAACRCIPA